MPEFQAVLPLFTDSYKHLLKALSSEKYELVDLLMEAQDEGKPYPVTFADVVLDDQNRENP